MVESGEDKIQVEVSETGPISRELEVGVPAFRVEQAFLQAFKQLGKQVSVKGFRKGKVPVSVLKKLYGTSVAEDVERLVVSETLPEALEKAEIRPVAEPAVDGGVPLSGEDYSYRATVEVKPLISLPGLTGLSAKRPKVAVEEDSVVTELDLLRDRRASFVDETPETNATGGHHLTIDYVGRIKGEAFEGGSGEGVTLEIGGGRFIPGFEEQLEGAKIGEDLEVRVSFPEDYGHEGLAGEEATFAVHVVKIQRRDLPELDADFAKAEGDFDSIDALKDSIRERLVKEKEELADKEERKSVLDSLLEGCEFDAPPGMVESRLNQRLEMTARQLGQAFGDELPNQLARWREEWRDQSEREVKEHLVLEAVAADKGFEATEDDVEERLTQMTRDQGIDLERLRSAYEQPGMLDALKSEIASEQAVAFLRSEAKVEMSEDS